MKFNQKCCLFLYSEPTNSAPQPILQDRCYINVTLLLETHLVATSKETKTKLNTDFDIPLTEDATKKGKEDKKLEELIVSIDNPGECPLGKGPPGKGPPGKGPPGG